MKRRTFFPLVLALVSVAGCATIVNGKTQLVSFQSTPAGATIMIDGRPIGKTPLSLQLEKKSNQVLVVRKEGYKDFSTTMGTTVSGWFLGNIALGGVLGSTTDAATGAMYEYVPNQFLVTLEADGTNPANGRIEKSKADKIREFILLSYAQIAADIQAGGGSYLSSLLSQLEIKDESRDQAIVRIRGLFQAFPDVTQFADQVISTFAK